MTFSRPVIGPGIAIYGAASVGFSNPVGLTAPATSFSLITNASGKVGVDISNMERAELEDMAREGTAFCMSELNIWFKGVNRFASSCVPGQKGVELVLDERGSLFVTSFKTTTPFSLPKDGSMPNVVPIMGRYLSDFGPDSRHSELWEDSNVYIATLRRLWSEFDVSARDSGLSAAGLITYVDGAIQALKQMIKYKLRFLGNSYKPRLNRELEDMRMHGVQCSFIDLKPANANPYEMSVWMQCNEETFPLIFWQLQLSEIDNNETQQGDRAPHALS